MRILDHRLEYPRTYPYYVGRNRFTSNLPGSTVFVPVVDMTSELAAIRAGGSPPTEESSHCCSYIQRRGGRPICRKPGSKSPRRLGDIQSDPYRGASNLAGCSGSEPVKPRNRPPAWNGLRECRECRAGRSFGEGQCRRSKFWICDVTNSPGSERTACQEGMSSESSEPLAGRLGAPHSEGIAYKPPRGEIAMCLRVGRMRPIK